MLPLGCVIRCASAYEEVSHFGIALQMLIFVVLMTGSENVVLNLAIFAIIQQGLAYSLTRVHILRAYRASEGTQ
jgi:hypothetical protein